MIEYDLDRTRKPKVIGRYYGAENKLISVKSCVSPDGTFICSGSQSGKPYVWNTLTKELEHDSYNFKINDNVADIDWNNKYNMIACSGFGHEYPVMIYVYEKSRKEIDFALGRNYIDEEDDLAHEEEQRKEIAKNARMTGGGGDKFGTFYPEFGSPSQDGLSRYSDISSPFKSPQPRRIGFQ